VILDDQKKTVRFTVNGVGLDLGGIAKGYALDRAAERVIGRGIRIGILDLGGNLRCLPDSIPSSDQDFYRIGILNPIRKSEIMTRIPMRNNVIATSGDYERYVVIDDRHYTHIINPSTGFPVENMLSVSVVTRRGIVSDGLSTALFIRPDLAETAVKTFPGTQLLIVRRDPRNPKQILVESFGRIWENGETIRKQLN
jgi:Membrane-associated lipoprotein involved in thiamine biosynthesis